METQVIEKIALQNGLNLEIEDLSRLIAGDRWYIELKVRIPIPVAEHGFNSTFAAPVDIATLRKALGEELVFEQRFIRNFIDAEEKEAVVTQIRENLEANLFRYYNHPDFAAGYLRRQYQDFLTRRGIFARKAGPA